MGNARISVNINEDVKKDAQKIFKEIGMDMSTAIDTFLRAVVREERIPFDLQTKKSYQQAYRQYVLNELAASKREAADPDLVLIDHDAFVNRWDKKREARRNGVHN